jgi:hypothetical protein
MKREPVMTAAIVAGLVMAVALGWVNLSGEQIGSIENFLNIAEPLVVLAVPVIMAWIARQKVTPMSDPRTADGKPAVIVSKDITGE